MGLALEVGILADLGENDPEGAEAFQSYFARLNEHLLALGMKPHDEPTKCEVWSGEMYGYSGLHYLRRLAAHIDSTGKLPSPGDDSSSHDPLLEAYFSEITGGAPPFLGRLFRKRPTFKRHFDHLIVHSDAEGFYLPAEFTDVILAPQAAGIPGGMVGSVPCLLAELNRLALALEIPDELDSASDELWEAPDSQGEGDLTWQRYGVESFSCVTLREGCRHAMKTGAALVFV
jgi:hypothetical protein